MQALTWYLIISTVVSTRQTTVKLWLPPFPSCSLYSGGADKKGKSIIKGDKTGKGEKQRAVGGKANRMGMMGGISEEVTSYPKEKELRGREFQVEGTYAKVLGWKRAWHILGTEGKTMRLEHSRPKKRGMR